MIELRLVKLFAWAIGVLIVLWMLTECLGGVDEADPGNEDLNRDTEQYAADCDRAWEALDLAAGADHGNVTSVLDRIDELGNETEDPNLKALTESFGQQAEAMVTGTSPEDAEGLEDAQAELRDRAALDLAMRCPIR